MDYIVDITVIHDWLILATITVKLLHVMLYQDLYNCCLIFRFSVCIHLVFTEEYVDLQGNSLMLP